MGDPTRQSIDDSHIHRDLIEASSIKDFLEYLSTIFFNFCGIGNGHYGLEVPSPNVKFIKKPGDFDIVFWDEKNKQIHGFETKRIKVSDKINKLGDLKKAKAQINGYIENGFNYVWLVLIIAADNLSPPEGYRIRILEKLDKYLGRQWLKENGIGVIFLDHIQEQNVSLNTRQRFRITIFSNPKYYSGENDLYLHISNLAGLIPV